MYTQITVNIMLTLVIIKRPEVECVCWGWLGGGDGGSSGRVLGRVENSFRTIFIVDSEERKQTS